MSKVRVLYDFNAESANEITTFVGEELTVLDPNSFEGWLKIRNKRGEEGIVPSAYVENIDDEYIPPPPSSNYPVQIPDSWNGSEEISQPPAYVNSPAFETQNSMQSNNNYTYNPTATSWDTPAPTPASAWQPQIKPSVTSHYSDSDDFDEDDHTPSTVAKPVNKSNGSFSTADRHSTLSTSSSTNKLAKHKTKNSFGLDVFLLCGAVKSVLESEKYSTIMLNDHRQSLWKRRCPPYSVSIINHIIDKKYHGVKTFVSYEIQTEKFPQRVRRRYNQFDWLHERLEEKYPNICVPPLPDKALKGNFEEDFIMKRKSKLELWLNRLSSHPVINESEVFIHFLQCDNTSDKWKAGKRKAEKDEYRGSQWFATLTVPGESTDTITSIKDRVEKFSKSAQFLDYNVKNVCTALEKVSSMHASTYKKELNNLGKRFEEFGTALSAEPLDSQNNNILSQAMVTCGNTYNQLGNSFGEQPREDCSPLLDRLYLYRGIIQQMPDIMQFEKNAIQTYEEFQQKPDKLLGKNLMEVAPRREIISHVTFAEINQFNRDKVEDITICMKTFLQKQIEFYSEITECLKRSLAGFDQIPVTKKF